MSTQQPPDEGEAAAGSTVDELSFDKADVTEAPGDLRCAVCTTELWDTYFEINDKPTCERCRYQVEQAQAQGAGTARFVRATLAGLAGAAVGAGIYYAVLALTGYEIGLIAILVGFLVGGAVRWGAHGRGGWLYQTLAVALTYIAIVGTYIPFVLASIEELDDPAMGAPAMEETVTDAASATSPEAAAVGAAVSGTTADTDEASPSAAANAAGVAAAPAGDVADADLGGAEVVDMGVLGWVIAVVFLLGLALILPFLAGLENIIGLLIIGFALFQAWSMNKKGVLRIEGPYRIGDRAPAAEA